ncbi:hypothetical protein FOXYSP1_16164 [Fusarium oxysporum f. sp. phaseoli]
MDHTQPSLSAWPLCSETQPGTRSQGMVCAAFRLHLGRGNASNVGSSNKIYSSFSNTPTLSPH